MDYAQVEALVKDRMGLLRQTERLDSFVAVYARNKYEGGGGFWALLSDEPRISARFLAFLAETRAAILAESARIETTINAALSQPEAEAKVEEPEPPRIREGDRVRYSPVLDWPDDGTVYTVRCVWTTHAGDIVASLDGKTGGKLLESLTPVEESSTDGAAQTDTGSPTSPEKTTEGGEK